MLQRTDCVGDILQFEKCFAITEHRVLLSAIKEETKSAQNIHQHTCCIYYSIV